MDLENKYGTLEIQKSTIELLKVFSSYAKANSISYSLVDGSMLGAVRHHGFIPWDDDVDIIVNRHTFNELINSDLSKESFCVFKDLWLARIQPKYRNEQEFVPTIDIIILDKAPSSTFLRRIKLLLIYMMQGMMKKELNLKKGGIIMKACSMVTWLMGLPFSYQTKYRWYGRISSLWGGDKFTQCYNTIFDYIPVFFDGDVMDKLIEVQFEDMMLPIMSKYDHWLSKRFGDYMTPPKIEDRVPRHNNINNISQNH